MNLNAKQVVCNKVNVAQLDQKTRNHRLKVRYEINYSLKYDQTLDDQHLVLDYPYFTSELYFHKPLLRHNLFYSGKNIYKNHMFEIFDNIFSINVLFKNNSHYGFEKKLKTSYYTFDDSPINSKRDISSLTSHVLNKTPDYVYSNCKGDAFNDINLLSSESSVLETIIEKFSGKKFYLDYESFYENINI